MARYERDGRDLPVSPQAKIKLRRREDGSLEIAPEAKPETIAQTAREDGQPLGDDPRSPLERSMPNATGY